MYTDVDADARRSARVVPCTVSDATCAMALSVASCCAWERLDSAVVRSAEDNMLGGAEGCMLRCGEVDFNFCVMCWRRVSQMCSLHCITYRGIHHCLHNLYTVRGVRFLLLAVYFLRTGKALSHLSVAYDGEQRGEIARRSDHQVPRTCFCQSKEYLLNDPTSPQ